MFLLLLLLIAVGVFLLRSGTIGGLSRTGTRTAPEDEAKQVLAERFARSEISSDEFIERASVLNWTPGSETWPPRRGRSTTRAKR